MEAPQPSARMESVDVKVTLPADLALWLHDECKRESLSYSSYLRRILSLRRRAQQEGRLDD